MKKTFIILTAILFSIGVYYFYPEKKLPKDIKIDKIVVRKSEREMDVFSKGQLLKTYTISLGGNPVGHKQQEGDKRTPEGRYMIDSRNDQSGYHKNLGISYPNATDLQKAKSIGKSAGGHIKIHGIRNGIGFIGKFHRWFDWTAGCIALTNEEVDELYNAVDIGTPIEILP